MFLGVVCCTQRFTIGVAHGFTDPLIGPTPRNYAPAPPCPPACFKVATDPIPRDLTRAAASEYHPQLVVGGFMAPSHRAGRAERSPTPRPLRLVAQDTRFSSWKQGFDSPRGYSISTTS